MRAVLMSNYPAFNLPQLRQDAVLSVVLKYGNLSQAETVFTSLTVADFDPGPRQNLARIAESLMRDKILDPIKAGSEARKFSEETFQYFVHLDDSGNHYNLRLLCADILNDTRARQMQTLLARAQNEINHPEADVSEIQKLLLDGVDALGSPMDELPPDDSLEDILGLTDEQRPWVVPNMLRSGEVLLLTGWEGSGKSMLVSQIALGASCGVNTLTLEDQQHEPVPVFVVDVENSALDVRDNLNKVWPVMKHHGQTAKPDIRFSSSRFAELSNPRDRRNLISRIDEHQPKLVTLGSLYKLAPLTNHDDVFNLVMTTVREIQEKTGAAVLIEHHAGQAQGANGDRDIRPYGSSMFRRWPNFGIGLSRSKEMESHAQLVRWRGDRARGRTFPFGLKERLLTQEASMFPWLPITEDEYNFDVFGGPQ